MHTSAKKHPIKVDNKNTTAVDVITVSTKDPATTLIEYVLVLFVPNCRHGRGKLSRFLKMREGGGGWGHSLVIIK